MKTRLVIFDLDGTLIDSLEGIVVSMNIVLKKIGAPLHPGNRYRSFIGDGIFNFVKRSLPDDRNNTEFVTECIKEYKLTYRKMWSGCTSPFPGIGKLLDELDKRNIVMSVLSNKTEETVKEMVEILLPAGNFNPVWGSKEGIPNKPDPFLAFKILKRHKIDSRETLLIGDSGIDISTAKSAGIKSVGAAWGIRPVSELIQFSADFIIDYPCELLEIIDNKP